METKPASSCVEPSGPDRPFRQVMQEAYERELATPRLKKHRAQQARLPPPQPEGWQSVTVRQCNLCPQLWPKPRDPVMVPFPQDWREGVVTSKEKDGGAYLIKLNGTGSLMTLSLSQFLVKA